MNIKNILTKIVDSKFIRIISWTYGILPILIILGIYLSIKFEVHGDTGGHCSRGFYICVTYSIYILRYLFIFLSTAWIIVNIKRFIILINSKSVGLLKKFLFPLLVIILFLVQLIVGWASMDIRRTCSYYRGEFGCYVSNDIMISRNIYSFDVENSGALIGAANNAFIGKVVRKIPDSKMLSAFPETQYEVEVIENIKGNLNGTVTVNQEGGIIDGTLYASEDSDIKTSSGATEFLLTEGSTYFFATRFLESENWHTVIGHRTARELISEIPTATAQEILKFSYTNERVQEIAEAYTKEIPLEADVISGNVANAYTSLSTEQKEKVESIATGEAVLPIARIAPEWGADSKGIFREGKVFFMGSSTVSDVAKLEYSINGITTTVQDSIASIVLDDGIYDLTLIAYDKDGLQSEITSFHMNIRRLKPLTITADEKSVIISSLMPEITFNVEGFVNGDTYASSVKGIPSCNTTATSTNIVGDYVIICDIGTLFSEEYNFKFTSSVFHVRYNFGGFENPIIPNTIYKAGRTIPVKFQLKNAQGNIVEAKGLPQWVTVDKLGLVSNIATIVTDATSIDSGSTYRYEITDKQYIYNWSTRDIAPGYWYRIGAKLDDGTVQSVVIGVK